MKKIVKKVENRLKGEIEIPSDKSISHRAVMFASLAKGTSIIKNFSNGQDPHSTLEIFKQLGIEFEQKEKNSLIVKSNGILKPPKKNLYCGNSGTTMRLMSGILAGQNFNSTLTGDESLSQRPMKRIIEPLNLMGGNITAIDNHAPLNIKGRNLIGTVYNSKISSAQVKSCVLLASLNAEGSTIFNEPYLSRNHTEILLKYMGANIESLSQTSTKIMKSELTPKEIDICGDISSATYFIVSALIVPNSSIIIKNVGLNPTRTGILDVVKKMNGNIEILNKENISGEERGDLKVRYSKLKSCTIEGELIPKLIDEIPAIAVLATQAEGQTIIKNAEDLRNKESDRISTIVSELKKLGANIKETPDGFIIEGISKLKGGVEVETYHDHRLVMSLYTAGLICQEPICINGFEWLNISFPEFEKLFNSLFC